MLATEKVTRKALDSEDHKRLIEEALDEVDFSALAGNGNGTAGESVPEQTAPHPELRLRRRRVMDKIARVYAEALFQVAREKGKLDAIREQLGQFADVLAGDRDLQVFFFSPYFSSAEKRDGIERAISGAEPELINFLELLTEKHRMPVIFRIRTRFDELWAKENKLLEVRLTSAVELDPADSGPCRRRDRAPDRPQDRARERDRRGHPRRARAASRQHGP